MDARLASPPPPDSLPAGAHAVPATADANWLHSRRGMWLLDAGRAATLRPQKAGQLTVAHGRVWVTFSHAAGDLRVRAGDHFLGRGESLAVAAGDVLVLEPFSQGHASPVYFSWDAVGQRAQAPTQPLGFLAGALAALRGAAGGLAAVFVVGRARTGFEARAFRAQSSASRAHCSIN